MGVDISPGTGDGAWCRTQWILFLNNVNIMVPEWRHGQTHSSLKPKGVNQLFVHDDNDKFYFHIINIW